MTKIGWRNLFLKAWILYSISAVNAQLSQAWSRVEITSDSISLISILSVIFLSVQMGFSLSVGDVAFAICARTLCLEPLSNVFVHTYLKHVANSSCWSLIFMQRSLISKSSANHLSFFHHFKNKNTQDQRVELFSFRNTSMHMMNFQQWNQIYHNFSLWEQHCFSKFGFIYFALATK